MNAPMHAPSSDPVRPSASDTAGQARGFTPAEVADFARAVAAGDPLDWSAIEADPDAVFELMAGQVLESLARATAGTAGAARARLETATLLGLVVRATVESFALNQRLLRTSSRLRAAEGRLARLGAPLE